MEPEVEAPPRGTKVFFWFILGSLSVFFAEVISGSEIFPFTKLTGWILIFPLYTLHTVVLWTVVFRYGRGWLYALFPAGALFGLYEAYITKVLWSPTWGGLPFYVGGVAVVETALLVLFWHSFMAFIIPLFIAETVLTSSREMYTYAPSWAQGLLTSSRAPMLGYALFVCSGLFSSQGAPSALHALASGVICTVFLWTLVHLWERRGGSRYSFRDLLPGPRGIKILFALLVLDYVALGAILRPEMLPEVSAQATIWVLYAFFGTLLYLAVKRSKETDITEVPYELRLSTRRWLILTVLFTSAAFFGRFTGLGFIFALASWLAATSFGVVMLVLTIRNVVLRRSPIHSF
jgi:hypothetical protein